MAGNGRGGRRPGAGRPLGSPDKARVVEEVEKSGITPLQYFLDQLRSDDSTKEERMSAAIHAAPYCHPRLNAINHSGTINMSHEEALDELDRLDREEEEDKGESIH